MTYTHATDPPPRYQWERWDSEPPNGSINCNATSCTYIVDFYREGTHNINALRRMVGAVDGHTFSCAQVKAALAAYGIPAYIAQLSFAGLKSLLSTGRRPVLVGLWDARVPPAVRGHGFTGMHGVVMLANTWRNGVSGILVMDPNFNPPYRDDPTHGERFYPDTVVAWAMFDYNLGKTSWSVVPTSPKVVAAPAPVPPSGALVVQFAAGTYTGRQFSSSGATVASKMATLTHGSSAPASMRSLIVAQPGYWFFITDGIWAGFWIPEGPGVNGAGSAPAPAPPPAPPATGFPRNLSFAAGTYTGHQFDANGSIIATRSYTLGHSSSAPASRRSLIKNQTGYWYFVTAGVWAGYWIRETAGIS